MTSNHVDEAPHHSSRETTASSHDWQRNLQPHELESFTGLEDRTLDSAYPRPWHTPMTAVSVKLWRQFLGLNPFRGSYFGLYGSLQGIQEKIVVCCAVIFAIAAGVPLPIIGVIFGKIVDGFPPDEAELRTRISELLGVAVAYFIVTTIYTISFGRTGEKIAIHLRKQVFSSLLHLDQAYMDTRDVDSSALLSEKIDTIQVGCSEKVGIFIQSLSYFAAAVIVGLILNAKLTGILLAGVMPTMTAVVWIGSRKISKLTKRLSDGTEQANTIVESALKAVRITQAFDMVDRICAVHWSHLEQISKISFRKALVSALELGGAYFTAYAINGLAFYVGSRMAASGQADGNAGTIYAIVFLILDASFVVGQFAPFLEIFARAASAYGAIQELVEANSAQAKAAARCETVHEYDIHGKEIILEHISFSYPARPTVKALDGLSLKIRPGQFTAIVGTSGGGKSTLVSLLLRIYGYSGHIMVGSEELRTLSVRSVRSQVSVLDQNCVLFSGSVLENICHGLTDQELSEDERVSRAKQAATDASVTFDLHTRIDNTRQLSGGEKQRVCLARALIRRPAVLILDEPTSALDSQSQEKVVQAVKRAVSNGTTVLMIAHRLSTVLEADCVCVVGNGHVLEEGTPHELAMGNSVFRELLDAQDASFDAVSSGSTSTAASSADSPLEETEAKEQTANETVADEDTDPRTRQTFGTLLRLTRPERPIIIAGMSAAAISGSIILGEALVFGNLVQLLNSGKNDARFQHEADFSCLMFFVLACIALVAYVSSGTAMGVASAKLTARIQALVLRNLLQLDVEWYSQPGRSAHELSLRLVKDSGDLASLSGVALGSICSIIVSVLGGIILAHAIAWKIAIVLLSTLPIILAAGYVRSRMLAISETRQRTAYGGATALAIESCRNKRTVNQLGLESFVLQRYFSALETPHKASRAFTVLCNALLASSFAITYFVYALAYWWGSLQVRKGHYSQKQFFTVLPALLFSAQAAGQLFSLSPEIVRAKTATASIFRLLAFQPTILDRKPSVDVRSDKSPPPSSPERLQDPQPAIEFKDVAFSYPSNPSHMSLKDVNLTVWKGQTVAFVGPSGAGKSSMIGLIERFYDPSAGEVTFEGTTLRDMDVCSLRSRLALVSQEPELFPGSIEYNIRLGATAEQVVTDEQVTAATKQCGLHDFISSLPEGYNTKCGSSSSPTFSGGQMQRLSLARALIRDPDILLLDEPTSALDARSEQQVQEALNKASKNRTTITVAHRLASIQHADKIIVLNKGSVEEQGTHSELISKGGLYADMAKLQALS